MSVFWGQVLCLSNPLILEVAIKVWEICLQIEIHHRHRLFRYVWRNRRPAKNRFKFFVISANGWLPKKSTIKAMMYWVQLDWVKSGNFSAIFETLVKCQTSLCYHYGIRLRPKCNWYTDVQVRMRSTQLNNKIRNTTIGFCIRLLDSI